MADEDYTATLRVAIEDAVSASLRDNGEMAVRWVAMVEVVGDDGSSALYSIACERANTWDVLGMLYFGIQRTQALTNREEAGGQP